MYFSSVRQCNDDINIFNNGETSIVSLGANQSLKVMNLRIGTPQWNLQSKVSDTQVGCSDKEGFPLKFLCLAAVPS